MNRERPSSRLPVALAVAGLACMSVTGCGSDRTGSSASQEPSSASTSGQSRQSCAAGDGPVASVTLSGGFAGGRNRSGPPWVAVYPDGRAVLNGGPTVRLSDAELQDFLTTVSSDLASQPQAATPSGYAVADARTVTLTVRTCGPDAQSQTVTATGLDAVPDAFPPKLVHAYAEFTDLAHQITGSSQGAGSPSP